MTTTPSLIVNGMKQFERIQAAWLAILFLAMCAVPAASQDINGSVFGTVRDSSGAAVRGAKLTLTQPSTGASRTSVTNDNGEFAISGVPAGGYTLAVSAAGFKTLEYTGIVLTASERLSLGVLVVEVGAIQERVTVKAQGTEVQTVSAERSAAITGSQVEGLLIRGRSVTSLAGLLPGVVDPAVNQGDVPDGSGAANYNVQGNRTAANSLTLDGLTFTQNGGAPNAFFGVSMDSIAEVKILLSNYQAEYGRLSGANIQMVTKSGAREFHGGGSYFKRHEELNANNFFNNQNGQPKGIYRYNTWAYNIGGPIYIPGKFNSSKDKLFFFWSQEFWPQKSTNALQYSTVPTALERSGDFSKSTDVNGALIVVKDPNANAPFAGNIVPASRIDPNGQALLKVFPQPNFVNTAVSKGAYNNIAQWTTTNPFQLQVLKLNYNIRSNDAISVTYSGSYQSGTTPNSSASGAGITAPFVLGATQVYTGGDSVGVHYQHIFSPTMINEFTIGYVQSWHDYPLTNEELPPLQRATYGFNAAALAPSNNPLNLLPAMSFGGVTGAAGISYDGRFPLNNYRAIYDLSDNLSKTLGPHTLKAGIFMEKVVQVEGPNAANFMGNFDFGRNVNNPLDSNHPYANAILGNFNSYQEATSRPNASLTSNAVDWYVQDNWRVNARLTLDYGMRVSWFQPFSQDGNLLAEFVPSLYDPAQKVQLILPALNKGVRSGVNPVSGQFYPASLIGFLAPGVGNPTNGIVNAASASGFPKSLIETPAPQVAPRIGFAYDPFGDGKTAIRGGFGMFYDRFLSLTSGAAAAYPIVQTPLIQFGAISQIKSAQGFVSAPGQASWDRNMKPAQTMNMSLSIQRNIGFGTVVDIGYVGSLGRRLTWQRSLQNIPIGARFLPANADPTNPKVPLPDVFLRPIQGYSDITQTENAGSSNYHSMQVSANRRFARSFQLGASWTWSKSMDFADAAGNSVNTLAPFRAWNYGEAGFDRTHVLKINWLWSLPGVRSKFAPARAILNNWQLSGIETFSSGAPVGVGFTQVTATDLIGTPSISPRIVVTGDPNQAASGYGPLQAFNPTVFAPPALGSLGGLSKSLLRGPGIANWDVGVVKGFSIRDRLKFQFRSEFYNAFNHTQFSAFNATARFDAKGSQVNQQFGQYTAARNPRFIQLALKMSF